MSDPIVRIMGSSDIQAALAIGDLEGWNQTESDWQRLLALAPGGCFAAEIAGDLAGTVTALAYRPNLAWIGMMLVHPRSRGRGVASALMRHAIDHLRALGISTIKLDATDAGRAVYQRFGFEDETSLIRCTAASIAPPWGTPDHAVVRLVEADLEAAAALDRSIFGADRGSLLALLRRASPETSYCVRGNAGDLRGFAMTRPGARARYLGPWVASDRSVAQSLLHRAAEAIGPGEPTYVDVHSGCPEAITLLAPLGFKPSRSCTRMFLGEDAVSGRPEHVYGLSGFETG